MLKIRLARHGRKKAPFYRIVLTEHTKPAQSGYKLVLWRFNPLSHTMEANIDEIKNWISKWAQPSERVAKLLFAETKDKMFKEYFLERESTKWKAKEAEKKAEAEAKQAEAKEKSEAAAKAEAEKVEEAKPEEANDIVEEKTEEKIEDKVEEKTEDATPESKEEIKEEIVEEEPKEEEKTEETDETKE